jgi:hypothetical protein
MMVADMNAIPDDKWTDTFGGCTRPCNALLADTVTNLTWTIATMKGETSNAYSEMGALAETFADKAAALEALQAASREFAATLVSASDETLNSTVTAPWNMPVPVFILAEISVNHIWYHDGQLNYVQCLLGDEKVHWMP